MSNNASPVIARIQQSTIVFIVLVFAVGALLLATTGLDPRTAVRASLSATPVPPTATNLPTPTADPFAFNSYKSFTSPDGVLSINLPDSWRFLPDPRGQKTYSFSPDASPTSDSIFISITVGARSDIAGQISGVTAQSSPRDILAMAVAQQSASQGQLKVTDVKVGKLAGASVHQSNATREGELWLLSLDSNTLILIQVGSPQTLWTGPGKMAEVFAKMMEGLVVDAVKAAATQAATSPATLAATQAATAPR